MSYPTLFTTPGVKDFAEAVDAERQRQLAKWGDQKHPDGTGTDDNWTGTPFDLSADFHRRECQAAADRGEVTWAHITLEEVYEALAETEPEKLLAELDQAAAVLAAWRYDVLRRMEETNAAGCPAGLLPLGNLSAPIERCVVHGKHSVHETVEGRKWTNADAGIEELDT